MTKDRIQKERKQKGRLNQFAIMDNQSNKDSPSIKRARLDGQFEPNDIAGASASQFIEEIKVTVEKVKPTHPTMVEKFVKIISTEDDNVNVGSDEERNKKK